MKQFVKVTKCLILGFIGVYALVIGGAVTVHTAHAAIKAELIAKVKKQTGEAVKHVYYTDYDYDGVKEAFIITEKSKESQTLWFSSDRQVKELAKTMIWTDKQSGICKVGRKQKVFVAEGSGGGSGSWSYCFYVRNGKVCTVEKSGSGLKHVSGADFTIYASEFDEMYIGGSLTGHTWKEYYIKWTGTKFEEYKVDTIYKRSNGIVNINVSHRSGDMINYDNVNLEISGKSSCV